MLLENISRTSSQNQSTERFVAATGTASRAPPMGTMERIKSFIVGGMDTDSTEKTNQVHGVAGK